MGIERAAANVGKEALLRWSEATGMRGFPPNMRTRNADGALRHTRGDKLLATVREQFQLSKEALASHSDRMHLSTLRKLRGVDSENDILKGTMGLKGGRDVNLDGTIRGKRADTHIGTIEKQYHVDFGVRSDMHLSTLKKRLGAESMSDAVRKVRNR